jgi:hypothetical protein
MNGIGIVVTLVTVGMMFGLPRRWWALPFIVGASFISFGQDLEIGSLHFSVIRILVVVAFLLIISKGERIAGGLNSIDWFMILWAAWAVFSSLFHQSGVLVTRLGDVCDDLGVYFVFRVIIREEEDILRLFKIICVVLVPVSVAMMLEKMTGTNYFSMLYGGPLGAVYRHGHFRARGPFAHAILAGTIGAVCFPMALYLWRQNRKLALTGIAATGAIVLSSGSSGPIMALMAALLGLGLWKFRDRMRLVRWGVVCLLVMLNFIMKDPVYYLVARIDLTGGSTGWFRAALIDGAIRNLDTWWLMGTDYTRNWMPTGVYWNTANTDITDHFILMGVWGGLPLMILFIGIVSASFATVGQTVVEDPDKARQFLAWTLGAILFGHTINFLSVSYYAQSLMFLYILFACIGSLSSVTQSSAAAAEENEEDQVVPSEA